MKARTCAARTTPIAYLIILSLIEGPSKMPVEISLTVNGSSSDSLQQGVKKIALAVKPHWKEENLKYQQYTSGITNQLVGVWDDVRDKQLLVRVYGALTEKFIDRDAEKRNIEILHGVDLGPELLAVFNNGICYSFTVGIPTTHSLIIQDHVRIAVAKEMAKLHKTEVGDNTRPMTFPKIRNFLVLIPEKFESEKQSRLEERKYNKNLLQEEVTELEMALTSLGCPIVFCHNDILLGNIIWNENTKRASFIDFEYAAANYQAFDIGNHFNEFAGVDEVDYTLYPDQEFQYKWIRNYLSNYLGVKECEVDESEVKQWYIWANTFSLASHLLWASWALVQAHLSNIDFDYIGYSIMRLDEYFKRKSEVLSLIPKRKQD